MNSFIRLAKHQCKMFEKCRPSSFFDGDIVFMTMKVRAIFLKKSTFYQITKCHKDKAKVSRKKIPRVKCHFHCLGC